MIVNPGMLPKVRSRVLLDEIGTMPCALRISSFYPGHKCAPRDTVVPAHIATIGKGMGTKTSDHLAVAACLHCHDIIDVRDLERWEYITGKFPTAIPSRIIDAIAETQLRLIAAGIITVKGNRNADPLE